jgi:hypothetical protein
MYLDVLIQWLFFFGLLSILLLPAFLFRNLARMYGKNGWLYFILGLIVGGVAINFGNAVAFLFKEFILPKRFIDYAWVVLLCSAFLFLWGAFKLLKHFFSRQ